MPFCSVLEQESETVQVEMGRKMFVLDIRYGEFDNNHKNGLEDDHPV
jgi:hypothetical protein